jgi:hypothetical protein
VNRLRAVFCCAGRMRGMKRRARPWPLISVLAIGCVAFGYGICHWDVLYRRWLFWEIAHCNPHEGYLAFRELALTGAAIDPKQISFASPTGVPLETPRCHKVSEDYVTYIGYSSHPAIRWHLLLPEFSARFSN